MTQSHVIHIQVYGGSLRITPIGLLDLKIGEIRGN